MPEHPNVQRIRDAYAALAEGDLTEALKDIAPTATFHIGGSGPLSGDRTGIESITSALVGASSWPQIEECLGALRNGAFDPAELEQIDALARDGELNIWAASSQSG